MSDQLPPVASSTEKVEMASYNPADFVSSPAPAPPKAQPRSLQHDELSPTVQSHPASQNEVPSQRDVGCLHKPGRQDAYNMMPMTNTLPQVPYRGTPQYPSGGQQRYNPATSPPMMSQMPHLHQYGPSPSMPMTNQGYYAQHPPHMPQYYGAGHISTTHSQSLSPTRQSVPYYPNQMVMGHTQPAYYYPHAVSYATPSQGMPNNMAPHGQYMPGSPTTVSEQRIFGQTPDISRAPPQQNRHVQDGLQSTVRGPPRKPRQSGHAIWIGNLPPQTDLMSLVHHVCKVAPGLESLFLISKSNCAFANFKDEPTCVDAQQKLHDSKFQSVRLVSRLRKSTVEGAGGATAPTGPSVTNPATSASNGEADSVSPSEPDSPNLSSTETPQPKANNGGMNGTQQDKFFVLKSLTAEDLELSVQTGIWATQSHNEETLNNAFKKADNVYLVFSANKSGEYFGYARMISEINEDPEAAIEFAPKVQASSDIDLPKAIPTEATEYAPKGRIIDDSARGTIFWELEKEDMESVSDAESEVSSSKDTEGEEEASKTWGKPFKLEWLSTNRLPFYRTRGLRNPWNSNREVKIARDGTELEPSVGRRLIGLFNRLQNTGQYGPQMRPPMGMIPAYPHMRPYGP